VSSAESGWHQVPPFLIARNFASDWVCCSAPGASGLTSRGVFGSPLGVPSGPWLPSPADLQHVTRSVQRPGDRLRAFRAQYTPAPDTIKCQVCITSVYNQVVNPRRIISKKPNPNFVSFVSFVDSFPHHLRAFVTLWLTLVSSSPRPSAVPP